MRTHQGIERIGGMPQQDGQDSVTTYYSRTKDESRWGFREGKIVPIQGPNGPFAAAALELHNGNQVVMPIHNIEYVELCETTQEQNQLMEMRERREQLILAAIDLCDKDGVDTLAIMELKSAVRKYKDAE